MPTLSNVHASFSTARLSSTKASDSSTFLQLLRLFLSLHGTLQTEGPCSLRILPFRCFVSRCMTFMTAECHGNERFHSSGHRHTSGSRNVIVLFLLLLLLLSDLLGHPAEAIQARHRSFPHPASSTHPPPHVLRTTTAQNRALSQPCLRREGPPSARDSDMQCTHPPTHPANRRPSMLSRHVPRPRSRPPLAPALPTARVQARSQTAGRAGACLLCRHYVMGRMAGSYANTCKERPPG